MNSALFYFFIAAANFDTAKHLNTHPALLGRTFNRPRLDTLQKQQFKGHISDGDVKVCIFWNFSLMFNPFIPMYDN